MFGYVKAYKPELRMRDYDAYKGVYCSLCKELGRSYGLFARFTLNYDFAFLAVVLLGTSGECCGFKKSRCSFNPLVRCHKVARRTEPLEFSAAAAMMMVYYKLCDDLADRTFFRSLKQRLFYPFAAKYRRRAARKYPELDEVISRAISKQAQLEAGDFPGLDACADPTAGMLSSLFSYGARSEASARILSRMGYCLGKWIYLADALDDLAEDLQSGGFNPIVKKYLLTLSSQEETKQAKSEVTAQLNNCIGEAISAFELLNMHFLRGIVDNVLYRGLPAVQKELGNKSAHSSKGLISET